ncbi:MAG: ABC transporter permease [Oligoflexales bacterium]|nr:ABC transporter permease [Oligoflexales bacterium]
MEGFGDRADRELKWTPFFSLVRRELLRFMHVLIQAVLAPLVNAALYLLIFGVNLGSSLSDYHGKPYLAFLIPGLIMMSALNNSFQNISSSVVASRFHGDLQDLKYMPLSFAQINWALSLGALGRGFLVAVVVFFVSEFFHFLSFGNFLVIENPLAFVVFLTIGCLSFAQIGLFVGFWAKNFEQLNAVGSFILLPLLYLGGVFFTIAHLPSFWRSLSQINPLFHLINGSRFGFLGLSDVNWQLSLLVSLVGLLFLYLLAMSAIKKGSFSQW